MTLYRISIHHESNQFIIREYKIVNSTPKYVDILPINIPQKKVVSKRIKKSEVGGEYFYSPKEAKEYFIKRHEQSIFRARSAIEHSEDLIDRIKSDLTNKR